VKTKRPGGRPSKDAKLAGRGKKPISLLEGKMKLASVFSFLLALSSTALPQVQEKAADTILHRLGAFLTSREFAVNFFANLGGAMAGVLLAFWIERLRTRRDARMLFGRILQTSRSELAYLKPMCESSRDALRVGKSGGSHDYFGVPATRTLLISPLVHQQAPYSLIMALTILCRSLEGTENVFRDARRLEPQYLAGPKLAVLFGDQLDKASKLMMIALEQIDLQLRLLGLEKTPDAATEEVKRRLLEVVQSPGPSMADQNAPPSRETPKSE
jgi:hypothetical protein